MLPKIPILRLPDSLDIPLPRYSDGIGTTLTLMAAVSNPIKIAPGEFATVPTGFQCALPLGLEAQIRSLPQFSESTPIVVLNAPVTIDASNHNPIAVTLKNMGHNSVLIRRKQPIATLVFSPAMRILWEEIKQPSKKLQNDTNLIQDTIPEYDASINQAQPSMPNNNNQTINETTSLNNQPNSKPFIPVDVKEIAEETVVTPEAVGPIVEKNAIRDEIRDEKSFNENTLEQSDNTSVLHEEKHD